MHATFLSRECENKIKLQNQSNVYLNWFLSSKSDSLNTLPFYEIELLAKNCSVFSEQSNFESLAIEEKQLYLPFFDVSSYEKTDLDYIVPIQQLQKIFLRDLEDDVHSVILHGSLATQDYIKGWSDIDMFVIIKDSTIRNVKRLVSFREKILECEQLLYQFDSIQHHGFQFITESDLMAYPEVYLPLEVLNHGVLLGGNHEIKLNIRDSFWEKRAGFKSITNVFQDAAQTGIFQHHPFKSEYLLGEFKNGKSSMYQLKYFLSVVMLLPAYFLGLKGRDVYKKYSFDACKSYITEESWQIIEKASLIRSQWELKEKYPYTPNKVPRWVRNILGKNYLNEGYDLIKEMNVVL